MEALGKQLEQFKLMRTKAQKEAGLTFDGEPSYSMPEDVSERDCSAPKGWTEIEAGKEAGHTALPWKAVRLAGQAYGTIDWEIVSPRNMDQPHYNPNEKRICTLQTDDEETKANARFICQAVNAHHELVKALDAMLYGEETVETRIKAEAALAKARGDV